MYFFISVVVLSYDRFSKTLLKFLLSSSNFLWNSVRVLRTFFFWKYLWGESLMSFSLEFLFTWVFCLFVCFFVWGFVCLFFLEMFFCLDHIHLYLLILCDFEFLFLCIRQNNYLPWSWRRGLHGSRPSIDCLYLVALAGRLGSAAPSCLCGVAEAGVDECQAESLETWTAVLTDASHPAEGSRSSRPFGRSSRVSKGIPFPYTLLFLLIAIFSQCPLWASVHLDPSATSFLLHWGWGSHGYGASDFPTRCYVVLPCMLLFHQPSGVLPE